MTVGPCVSVPKIESVSEKPSSAAHLGGQRLSFTGWLVFSRGGDPLISAARVECAGEFGTRGCAGGFAAVDGELL